MNRQTAKIVGRDISREQLMPDLEKYRQEAIRLGMTDAKVITTPHNQYGQRTQIQSELISSNLNVAAKPSA